MAKLLAFVLAVTTAIGPFGVSAKADTPNLDRTRGSLTVTATIVARCRIDSADALTVMCARGVAFVSRADGPSAVRQNPTDGTDTDASEAASAIDALELYF